MQKGITLVALIITVIVMLILVGVSINVAISGGLFDTATESVFRTEMEALREQVEARKIESKIRNKDITSIFTKQVAIDDLEKMENSLKVEIIYWGEYDIGINKITRKYVENNWESILKNGDENKEYVDNLYYIDSQTANGEEDKYLYDKNVDKIYKIPVTRIGKYRVHSIQELDYQKENGNGERDPKVGTLINDESQIVQVDGASYYEPDLSGFVLEKTKLVYCSEDMSNTKEVSAQEYIKNGKQREITEPDGTKYILHNYEKTLWANIVVENEGIKTYWVWIPRYSYQIVSNETKVKFVALDEEPEEGYILHSDFADGKKGIWVSKYEPSQAVKTQIDDFPYYIPDLTGFDKKNTYIEVYDEDTQSFKETKLSNIKDIREFSKTNKWFDYYNKIWANIKVVNPDTNVETWWVWIPRYAYNITGKVTEIEFIDTNNKPLSGEELPSNYVVHSAFTDGKKGIWVSKYEPQQQIIESGLTNLVNPPDMSGYNVDNTYIECYDEDTNTFKEQTLRSILREDSVINDQNIVETVHIDYSKINGTWYSYDKQIWANIRVVNPETKVETWWVWIPKYAYNFIIKETNIIFLDVEGNPTDGSTLPSNYIPHSAFSDGKAGIWASKYEPQVGGE